MAQIRKACDKCGECCRSEMGPIVFPSDDISLRKRLKVDREEFFRLYCDKKVLKIEETEIDIFFLKLIGGRCVFQEGNLCSVYVDRPFQCRYAPEKFLSYPAFWEHMKCVNMCELEAHDSSLIDLQKMRELIEGYKI